MDYLLVFGVAGLVLLSAMTGLWLLSLYLLDSGIVDTFWGIGFILVSWIYYLGTPDGYLPRKLLICTLVLIWGLRLSIHIYLRNRGKGEDFRYRAWRSTAGKSWWWRSYFKVFLLQGGLLWVISTPLLASQTSNIPERLTWLDAAGVLGWVVGFAFETMGDYQLSRFKANPNNQGKVLTNGLWRYTRHPNYFGDAMQWWGYFLIAAAAGGYWTILSPLIMTYLLRRVSGVTLLEKTMALSKPGYHEYMQTTSAFIPIPPRKK